MYNKTLVQNYKVLKEILLMGFADLKKKRGKAMLEKLLEKTNKDKGNSYEDDRMWKLQRDKQGNGFAIIRFLPGNGDNIPEFVKLYNHVFTGPGGWYIENSRTTIGEDDPVSEYNSRLWNSGLDENKNIARAQKRKLVYYSNIYVVKDPANPENEGKVFIFAYGKSIFDKLVEAMNPVTYGDGYTTDDPINPFDLWDGANFRLKSKKSDGYIKYIDSSFESPKPLFDNDEELEKVYNEQYDISELIAPNKFKPYDVLKKRLNKVLGVNETNSSDTTNTKQASPVTPKQPSQEENDIPFVVDEPSDDEEISDDILNKLASMVDDD